jgi:hypothetical protein
MNGMQDAEGWCSFEHELYVHEIAEGKIECKIVLTKSMHGLGELKLCWCTTTFIDLLLLF